MTIVVTKAAAVVVEVVRLLGANVATVTETTKEAIIMAARTTVVAHLLPELLLGTSPVRVMASQATTVILATLDTALQLQEWDHLPGFPQTHWAHRQDFRAT